MSKDWTQVSFMGSNRFKFRTDSGILTHPGYKDVVEAFKPSQANEYTAPDEYLTSDVIAFSRFAEPAPLREFKRNVQYLGLMWDRYLRGHTCLQVHCDPKRTIYLTCHKVLRHHWFTEFDGNCASVHLANHLSLEVARHMAKARGSSIPDLCIERSVAVPENEIEEFAFRVFFSIDVRQAGAFGERHATIVALITAHVEGNTDVTHHFKPWHYWRLLRDLRPIDITAKPWSYALFDGSKPESATELAPVHR